MNESHIVVISYQSKNLKYLVVTLDERSKRSSHADFPLKVSVAFERARVPGSNGS
jgi:hypothetical protein